MSVTRCREYKCANYVERSGYCPTHAKKHTKDGAERARYTSQGPFVKLSRTIKGQNPVCQRLERGVQCDKPSEITHHRHSPNSRPDLLLSVYDEQGVSNLLALCRDHHPPSDGTPSWREGLPGDKNADFVRTVFRLGFAKG
jgi:hypothetical protein